MLIEVPFSEFHVILQSSFASEELKREVQMAIFQLSDSLSIDRDVYLEWVLSHYHHELEMGIEEFELSNKLAKLERKKAADILLNLMIQKHNQIIEIGESSDGLIPLQEYSEHVDKLIELYGKTQRYQDGISLLERFIYKYPDYEFMGYWNSERNRFIDMVLN